MYNERIVMLLDIFCIEGNCERLLSSFFRPPRDRGYSVFSIKWTYGFLLSDLMLINLILMIVPNSINIHCTNRIISKIINLLCLKFIKKINND